MSTTIPEERGAPMPEDFYVAVQSQEEATEAQELLFLLGITWFTGFEGSLNRMEVKEFTKFDSQKYLLFSITTDTIWGDIWWPSKPEEENSDDIFVSLDQLRAAAQGRKRIKVGGHDVILTPDGAEINGIKFLYHELIEISDELSDHNSETPKQKNNNTPEEEEYFWQAGIDHFLDSDN